jgi:hypothetical protein
MEVKCQGKASKILAWDQVLNSIFSKILNKTK